VGQSCSAVWPDVNLGPCGEGELFVPGNEIRRKMGFENVSNRRALLLGGFDIDVDITLRIDDNSFFAGNEEIGSVGEATQIELLEIHVCLQLRPNRSQHYIRRRNRSAGFALNSADQQPRKCGDLRS
jgi:hypothetical protein